MLFDVVSIDPEPILLRIVQEKKAITVLQGAELSGFPTHKVNRALQYLEKCGLVIARYGDNPHPQPHAHRRVLFYILKEGPMA